MVLHETPVSMIFLQLYSILTAMKTPHTQERSGKAVTNSISVVGLILVWTIIWAHFPSKEELLSAQSASSIDETQRVPMLDLTIPGMVSPATESSTGTTDSSSVTTFGGLSVPHDRRAREIAEVKCEAEVQRYCPDSLAGGDRRRCAMQRLKRLDAPCQEIVRQRLVRWREAEGYKLACVEDVKRLCLTVQPGDGRILQCLQEHEQDLSEGCYQSLPKGHLHLRN
ncbi:MAG: cysteine rich repeat-containing protein [Nitrospira sp.]|nr:cysteine rich repeat-containing protein [Nitrospira sp.]